MYVNNQKSANNSSKYISLNSKHKNQMEKSKSNSRFEGDQINSTYWWVMKLDPDHKANYNPFITELDGFSKDKRQDEPKDKAYLFMSRILMLFKNGYLDKSLYIDIYMKRGAFINRANCNHLCTLNKKDYKLGDDLINDPILYKSFTDKLLSKFLTDFYKCIREGKDVQFLLPRKRPTFNKDEYTDVESVRNKMFFKTSAHLNSYAEKLIKQGHAFGQVMSFVTKYQEKYLELQTT